jgi:hypothetical protein
MLHKEQIVQESIWSEVFDSKAKWSLEHFPADVILLQDEGHEHERSSPGARERSGAILRMAPLIRPRGFFQNLPISKSSDTADTAPPPALQL